MRDNVRRFVVLAVTVMAVPACGGGGQDQAGSPPTTAAAPPGVVLIQPIPQSEFFVGEPVPIRVTTSGAVSRVEFFQGATRLEADDSAPFEFIWTGAPAGIFSLTAVAVDNRGAVTTSAPVSVTVTDPEDAGPVNRPPTVTLLGPAHGSSVVDQAPLVVEARADDPLDTVAGVEFFDGAVSLGKVTLPPYRILWTATPPGFHSLRAVATDVEGAAASTPAATVTVTTAASGSPPPVPPTVRPGGSLRGVCFTDASKGWVVGEQGRIFATADGGVTWFTQNSGTTAALSRVQFVDSILGWVVGADGTILRTTDGGAVWVPLRSGTTALLTGLSFVNRTTGWVVGGDGTILKTNDGGATWVPQASASANTLGAVSFATEQAGWVDGNGEILSTTDGGAGWLHQSSEFMSFTGIRHVAFFTDARFLSETRGTFVGFQNGGDVIFTTADGGENWSVIQMHNNFAQWRGVAVGDATHLWAVGSIGLFDINQTSIATSSDGGFTWTDQAAPTGEPLNGVWFVSARTGWTVGENGTILRTQNGGTTWVLLNGGS
ncbi:MAG: hypothetical protein EHM91_03745 [Planctomycetota bacterium]|nr:MAG: hypothetical protein EHM91_03745 [Planctomycetota bacterium]